MDDYEAPQEVENERWDAVFAEATRIAFGVEPDGTVTVYLRKNRSVECDYCPVENVKLQAIAVEFAGTGTKVCWTVGGKKRCDPPPPPPP